MSEADIVVRGHGNGDPSSIYDVPRLLLRPIQVLTVQEKLATAAIDADEDVAGSVVIMQPPRVRGHFNLL